MRLTRTPPPWVYDDPDALATGELQVCTAPLSDGTLVCFVSIGKRVLGSVNWEARLLRSLTCIFEHAEKHRIGFALVLHVRPNADLTSSMIKTAIAIVKSFPHLIQTHLKGTVAIVPNAVVEAMIVAAMTIKPPTKPFVTKVISAGDFRGVELTELGLPKDAQRAVMKQAVAFAWPDGSDG